MLAFNYCTICVDSLGITHNRTPVVTLIGNHPEHGCKPQFPDLTIELSFNDSTLRQYSVLCIMHIVIVLYLFARHNLAHSSIKGDKRKKSNPALFYIKLPT